MSDTAADLHQPLISKTAAKISLFFDPPQPPLIQGGAIKMNRKSVSPPLREGRGLGGIGRQTRRRI